MIRIAKIPLKCVEFFEKAINDTTNRRLPQERHLGLKRLMARKFAESADDEKKNAG
ncbi:hypothetical protein [Escherichia coli]|uniref:hypothetical protein n=1 Tax=Escherichia coli TaxID=562 RepID=UPI0034E4A954